jgi:hypothetical protein
MALVLSGLILIQTNLIKTASDIREEQFDQMEIAISWNEELIVIHRHPQQKNPDRTTPTDKNQHLIETREKLARLKQIIPILEQQIQEQLANND